jgi:hypothetical protein
MRAKTPLFLTLVALLLGSMFAVANPVAAAPAEVLRDSECFDYYWDDAVVTQCIEVSGVYQVTETNNGLYKLTVNGTLRVTESIDGKVVREFTENFNIAEVAKAGELLVRHELYSTERNWGDEAFSASFHLVIANGEVRLERSEYQ